MVGFNFAKSPLRFPYGSTKKRIFGKDFPRFSNFGRPMFFPGTITIVTSIIMTEYCIVVEDQSAKFQVDETARSGPKTELQDFLTNIDIGR